MIFEKPVTYNVDAKIPEIYSGTPSFLGLPVIMDPEEINGFDAVVMGAPWEGVVTWGGYSGCELAPKSIRNASIRYGGFLPEFGVDVFDHLKIGDFGDAGIVPGDTESTFNSIAAKTEAIISGGAFPITFGGDHSVTVPVLRALTEKRQSKIGVVHLDSHMDNLNAYGKHRFSRSSPLHRVYEMQGVDPKNIVHMGIRGPRNNPGQVEAARSVGATIMTAFEIKAGELETMAERALDVAMDGADSVYITVCSDVLDVAFNPGGPPDLCGLTSFELAVILRKLASRGLCGFDFVEIYPPTDPNNVSSHAAVWMTLYTLCGLVQGRMGAE